MNDHKCVRVMGGLGNQLFQYTFAKMLELKWNFHVTLDVSSYKKDKLRNLELYKYKVSLPKAGVWESAVSALNSAFISHNLPVYKTYRSENNNPHEYLTYEEIKEKRFFHGFFQNAEYINLIKNVILRDLRYKEQMSEFQKARIKEVLHTDSVALHIRRGDYLKLAGYKVISIEYYQQEMKIFREKIRNAQFYIFSDDIAWCKENLGKEDDMEFVDQQYSDDAVLQFELMRHCHHFVIGNSTFSWWASYLSGYDDKICVAPRSWFSSEGANGECRNALLKGYQLR